MRHNSQKRAHWEGWKVSPNQQFKISFFLVSLLVVVVGVFHTSFLVLTARASVSSSSQGDWKGWGQDFLFDILESKIFSFFFFLFSFFFFLFSFFLFSFFFFFSFFSFFFLFLPRCSCKPFHIQHQWAHLCTKERRMVKLFFIILIARLKSTWQGLIDCLIDTDLVGISSWSPLSMCQPSFQVPQLGKTSVILLGGGGGVWSTVWLWRRRRRRKGGNMNLLFVHSLFVRLSGAFGTLKRAMHPNDCGKSCAKQWRLELLS